jgi:hypothetical protein
MHENYTENFNPNNTIAQVSPARGGAPKWAYVIPQMSLTGAMTDQ